MLIDTMSYAGNIYGEDPNADEDLKALRRLRASGCSLFILLAITIAVISEAIYRLQYPSDGENVNA